MFQALAALEELEASGGTSVTCHVPQHPHSPTIQLTNPTASSPSIPTASKTSAPAFPVETLTDAEELRTARFWRAYSVNLPHLRQHTKPAVWRDLSDVASLEWFHYALLATGPVTGFTLNLSPAVEAQARKEPNASKWLSQRIARRLKDALGRKVVFWFAFEASDKRRLHTHGELQIAGHEAEAARKALRLAGGEWDDVRQHQAKTKEEPSVVWTNYSAKHEIFIRPLKGRFANLSRPINGDWLFATNELRRKACDLYTVRRSEVLVLMNSLKVIDQ